MEKPSSSSSKSNTKTKPSKDATVNMGNISVVNEDLLHNILLRLPAQSFASAACVSKSWNTVCSRILSRPRLSSALSLNPLLSDAVNEVINKVLSEPIRPDFAIVNVGSGFALPEIMKLIIKKLGSNIPIIVSSANGIIGRDVVTDELKEVKWGALFSGFDAEAYARNVNEGIVLTVGYVPGLKVEAIPLVQPRLKSHGRCIDKFIVDIKEYSASISGNPFPVGIILFGETSIDMKQVMEKLDYALPIDTVVVGDERSFFIYKSGNDSRNTCNVEYLDAVALVFAQDRDGSSAGNIKFHVALSNGVSAVGPRYKAASVKTNNKDSSTWLTARREGQLQLLDGHSILNDVNNLLENHIEIPDLYIGVIKKRKISIGSEKPMPRTYIAYHGVAGGDDEYLYVDGTGIQTGDMFQFYLSDPSTALASTSKVGDAFKDIIRLERNSKSFKGDGDNPINVFGGLIFACYGRGESFFGRSNVDSSPFLENFPGVPLAGIFCGGEMVRSRATVGGQSQEGSNVSCCVHVYSTVYLMMSYTPHVSGE